MSKGMLLLYLRITMRARAAGKYTRLWFGDYKLTLAGRVDGLSLLDCYRVRTC